MKIDASTPESLLLEIHANPHPPAPEERVMAAEELRRRLRRGFEVEALARMVLDACDEHDVHADRMDVDAAIVTRLRKTLEGA